jgi:hypothetical protein
LCGKRIVVYYPKSTGVITPKMPFLGIRKVTEQGTYSIYCADGYLPKDYEKGWLYEVDEKGDKIPGTDNPETHDPQEGNLGIFPFGLPWISLPSWMWLLVVAGVLIYISSGNEE